MKKTEYKKRVLAATGVYSYVKSNFQLNKMELNAATYYNRVYKKLALTKANICSPEHQRAEQIFSGEMYISKVSESLYKSFCQVSREPETGCLQEKKIP